MDYVYAAVLGVVQWVAEVLQISSSGHLVIAEARMREMSSTPLPEWLKGMTMKVALHLRTLLSIAVVYFKDLLELRKNGRLIMLIVLASVPVGVAGLLFKDQIEAMFDSTMAAGCGLLVTAAFLLIAKKWQRGTTDLDRIPVGAAWVIGIFQAIAILPGVSRAGSPVASGLVCGLKRPDAARFSFFIAIPAIGGATLLELIKILRGKVAVDIAWQPMLLCAVISLVVGLLCLRWLIRQLVADRLHCFAIYCLIAGSLTVARQPGLLIRCHRIACFARTRHRRSPEIRRQSISRWATAIAYG